MLLTQGWKRQQDGSLVVAAIALSPCTNGMSGWQVHVGCYAPDRGETIQHATWTFKAAASCFHTLLQGPVLNEMLTWVDLQEVQDIKATLGRIEALLKDIAGKLLHG
jgi:hypothetical protein